MPHRAGQSIGFAKTTMRAHCKVPFCEWSGHKKFLQLHMTRAHGISSRSAQRSKIRRAKGLLEHAGRNRYSSFEEQFRARTFIDNQRLHLWFDFQTTLPTMHLKERYRQIVSTMDERLGDGYYR